MSAILEIITLKSGAQCLVTASAQSADFLIHAEVLRDASKERVDDIFRTWIVEISNSEDEAMQRTQSKIGPNRYITESLIATSPEAQQDESETKSAGIIKLEVTLSPAGLIPPPTTTRWICYISSNPKSALSPVRQLELLEQLKVSQMLNLDNQGVILRESSKLERIGERPWNDQTISSRGSSSYDGRSNDLTERELPSILEEPDEDLQRPEHDPTFASAVTGDNDSRAHSSGRSFSLSKLLSKIGKGKGKKP